MPRSDEGAAIGVQYDRTRDRYVVRWREDGRQRNRRFTTEAEAIAFDVSLRRDPVGDERAIIDAGRPAH